MALKATIFKTSLQLSDIDRGHYHDYAFTLARHPSETDERMMVRILAFALHAHDRLGFSKGLSSEDEPALWLKNLNDTIELWIEVGLPSEDRLRKGCSRSQNLVVYAYGSERNVEAWWKKIADKLQRFDHLSVIQLPYDMTQTLASMTEPSMDLQCTINESEVWLGNGKTSTQFTPAYLKQAKTRAI